MWTLDLLQHYWWLVISLLGALLVFLMFVQGGQALLCVLGRTEAERDSIAASLGRKWELTFTTLVTFGGAFFASFPMFYSTSFGGACYVWLAILFVFVVQAVAYEYRRKPRNVLGIRTFNAFLVINGILGPLLLGTAVATLFTGANFTIDRLNLANAHDGAAVVISQWSSPWHGLEAVADWRNVLLGIAVLSLALTLACQFLMNDLDDERLQARARKWMRPSAVVFVLAFVGWLLWLLSADGLAVDADGTIRTEAHKYARNFMQMPFVGLALAAGVASALASIVIGWRGNRRAIWFGGAGAILAVLALLLAAGWNDTAYYPSLTDPASSLTIRNSSSSLFTLRVMSAVSLLIPFVVAYIWYVWRALSRKPEAADESRGR